MNGIDPPGPFYADPPFAVPPDIVLDLPAPLSVNRTRRIDWSSYPKVKAWTEQADAMFLMQKRKLADPIFGLYEIIITLRDGSRIDVDNTAKLVIDTVCRLGLVANDDTRHLRRLTIGFGEVEGCRVTIRPMS